MMPTEIIETLKSLNPISIFVYGSKAVNETNSKSDHEIGIVFNEDNYVSRSEIKDLINNSKYSIFPFRLSELKNYTIDTPFQKIIFINSLKFGNSKTIYGEQLIETLSPPPITTLDLLSDTYFNLGYALSCVRIYKCGNIDLANDMFTKSVFYSTRNYIYFKTKKLIVGYNNIYNQAKKLKLPNTYKELLENAYNIRNEKTYKSNPKLYFTNITYINKFIIPQLEENLKNKLN